MGNYAEDVILLAWFCLNGENQDWGSSSCRLSYGVVAKCSLVALVLTGREAGMQREELKQRCSSVFSNFFGSDSP